MRYFEKISFERFKKDIADDIKLYEEYPLPKRSTKASAGYDFHSLEDFTINPGETKKIPTGVKANMESDEAYVLIKEIFPDYEVKQAQEFIEILVAQLNAPLNFPAQMQSMTQNFLDKFAKDKALVKDEVKPKTSEDFLKLFNDTLINSAVEALATFDLAIIRSDLDESEKEFWKNLTDNFASFADGFIRHVEEFVKSGENSPKKTSKLLTKGIF